MCVDNGQSQVFCGMRYKRQYMRETTNRGPVTGIARDIRQRFGRVCVSSIAASSRF